MDKLKVKNGMDVLISFDTTGSMYPVLSEVRSDVKNLCNELFSNIDDLRIGIIAHGDYCDKDNPYTIRVMDFTKKISEIQDFVMHTKQTYGGDSDECYELVLNTAHEVLSWKDKRKKIMILIGDAYPHGVNYPDNYKKLDWKAEADILANMGVQIFAVHALSNYRTGSYSFYQTIANKTNGKYLTLDRFNEVKDLICLTCASQIGEEKVNEYISVIRDDGRMTKTLADNINILTGRKKVDFKIEGVQKEGLIPVVPGRFQVMTVDENCDIKGFVEKNGIEFKRGRGFYELTKHETVQQYKEIIIQERETGEMFTGAQVREKLGLQPQVAKGGVHESLSSRDTSEFRVFVQSTSYNRKLIAGTAFLYEISDLVYTGTTGRIEDIREKPKKATKTEKKEVKKTKKAETPKKKAETPKKKAETPKKKAETKIEIQDTERNKLSAINKAMGKIIEHASKVKDKRKTSKEYDELFKDTYELAAAIGRYFDIDVRDK